MPLGACLSCAKPELSRAAVTSSELVLPGADISKGPVGFASDHLIWQVMSTLTLHLPGGVSGTHTCRTRGLWLPDWDLVPVARKGNPWLSLGTVRVSISSSVVQRALKRLPSAMGLKPRSDCSHGTARSWRHVCAVFCVSHSSPALFTAASFTAQGGCVQDGKSGGWGV